MKLSDFFERKNNRQKSTIFKYGIGDYVVIKNSVNGKVSDIRLGETNDENMYYVVCSDSKYCKWYFSEDLSTEYQQPNKK